MAVVWHPLFVHRLVSCALSASAMATPTDGRVSSVPRAGDFAAFQRAQRLAGRAREPGGHLFSDDASLWPFASFVLFSEPAASFLAGLNMRICQCHLAWHGEVVRRTRVVSLRQCLIAMGMTNMASDSGQARMRNARSRKYQYQVRVTNPTHGYNSDSGQKIQYNYYR